MLLIDGVRYELWTPPNEDDFERVVKEHTQEIFSEQSKVCIIVGEVLLRG